MFVSNNCGSILQPLPSISEGDSHISIVNKTSDNAADDLLINQTCHEIDITNYLPPDADEKTANMHSMSIALDPNDPFDEALIEQFLSRLPQPISTYPQYTRIHENMPDITNHCAIKLGGYSIVCKQYFTLGTFH